MKERLAVLILNWNSAENTIALYHQLNTFIDTTVLELSIIVVDNDSLKSDQQKLKKEVNASDLIFTGENLGYAGGNNIGIRKALENNADYIAIMNPDIKINSDFISPLIKQLKQDTEIGVIGPRICFHDKPTMIYSDGGILKVEDCYQTGHINWKVPEIEVNDDLREVDYVNGSAMVIPRTSFMEFGGFVEDFFLYFEETEWCLRLKKLGKKVMVYPAVKVFHESSEKGNNYHFYMSRNRLWLAKMNKDYYEGTRNKYLLSAIKNFIKRKPFSWVKLKGVYCGIMCNPVAKKRSW